MNEQEEILNLANLWCEGRLSIDQLARMQSLLRSNGENCSTFVRFLQIHGQLSWEAGGLPCVGSDDELLQVAAIACCSDPDLHLSEVMEVRAKARLVTLRLPVAVAALLLAMCCGWWLGRPQSSATIVRSGSGTVEGPAVPVKAIETKDVALPQAGNWRPLQLSGLANTDITVRSETTPEAPVASLEQSLEEKDLNDVTVAAEIDRLLEQSWHENGIQPAAAADDHEWVRRVYLVLTGRISTQQEAAEFVQSLDREKRSRLISMLVSDDRTSENLAVIWTNLLIGRSNPRNVNQDALWGFLKGQFSGNRSWMETVGKLIAAEGRSDQQGETNFLLAHLNDQATPATAVTARLFLGRQVQCTQCHDHPFAQERSQDEFWTLNAFFKQTVRGEVAATEAGSDRTRPIWTLRDSGSAGMTFYENLRGQQKAVLPEFAGQTLNAEVTSRRAELVRLLDADNEHQVARAMVNRMWSMFFGYGFANPVDDLGSHNPTSHPELFDFLTTAFVKSNYDMQRLMRWISQSKAFGLSSQQQESIAALDDPQEGGVPLFSRSYPRPMGPEQVYDSLRTAIGSVSGRPMDSSVGTQHRREWVEQFVRAWGTDDNEESLVFGSNISQALLLMNGEDLQNAIPLAAAQVSRVSGNAPASVSDSLRMIALGTLNREPTDREEKVFRSRYRTLTRSLPPQKAIQTATEDMLWAYLNSSEFVSVH